MPFEDEGGPIHYPLAVPAANFHSGGINVPFSFVLAPESDTTATAIPLPVQSILEYNATLTSRGGHKVIPLGVHRIHLQSTEKRQGSLLRHRHKFAVHVSVISRGNGRQNLAWNLAGRWSRCFPLFLSCILRG